MSSLRVCVCESESVCARLSVFVCLKAFTLAKLTFETLIAHSAARFPHLLWLPRPRLTFVLCKMHPNCTGKNWAHFTFKYNILDIK